MRYQSMYTNTGNVKSIVGLLVVTFAVSVVTIYTPEIVNGIVNMTKTLTKTGKERAEEILHRGKKQYAVVARRYDGTLIDTGQRIWR